MPISGPPIQRTPAGVVPARRKFPGADRRREASCSIPPAPSPIRLPRLGASASVRQLPQTPPRRVRTRLKPGRTVRSSTTSKTPGFPGDGSEKERSAESGPSTFAVKRTCICRVFGVGRSAPHASPVIVTCPVPFSATRTRSARARGDTAAVDCEEVVAACAGAEPKSSPEISPAQDRATTGTRGRRHVPNRR